MSDDDLLARIAPLLGRETEPRGARDPVNQPMIRHWCDAVGDANPVYLDPELAAASRHGGVVAPPTMLQAWTMPGQRPAGGSSLAPPVRDVIALLDAAGFTSVVATDCCQEYRRYLRLGDRISVTSQVSAVSREKRTALGPGHFVDQLMVYRDADGREVARMSFRLLKFRPAAALASPTVRPAPSAARRPRPARTPDNAFFWQGVERGRLLIQRCARCARLRHPPGPMCPACHALEWEAVEASGRGSVYSFAVAHHPAVPPFAYPNAIVLVELAEGTRLVSNLVGVDPAAIRIGMPVRVDFVRVDPELVLPLFRPAETGPEAA
jgi:uncharacterized OB-fold protein